MFSIRSRTVYFHNNVIEIEHYFGHNYNLSSACYACIKRDIAATAPHNFDNRNPFVRRHCIAKFVYNVDTGIDRSIETKRVIGIFKVIVNSSGNTYRRNSVPLGKTFCPSERAVSAYDYKPLYTASFECFYRFLLSCFGKHFKASRRS